MKYALMIAAAALFAAPASAAPIRDCTLTGILYGNCEPGDGQRVTKNIKSDEPGDPCKPDKPGKGEKPGKDRSAKAK